MTRDRERVNRQRVRSTGGLLLLGATVVLALGAAATLVLSHDTRWVRLGAVAALWAALFGAFVAVRARARSGDAGQRAADLQRIYELELEREVAARREHELQVETRLRSKIEEESRDDIAALREELRSLRATLEGLLGGQVLVERYALHAESTRMRSLPEGAPPQGTPPRTKGLPAGAQQNRGFVPDPVTQQFDRYVEAQGHQAARRAQQPGQPRPPSASADGRVQGRAASPESSDGWFASGAFPRPPSPARQASDTPQRQPPPPAAPRRQPAKRDAREPEPPAGAHSQGQSVSDLLAAHSSTKPRRHRRRAE